MDSVSENRLSEVHPTLRARVTALISDCEAENIYLRVTMGLRSQNLQHALYIQGRQPLDVVNEARAAVQLAPITDEENIEVTHADYLDSVHCYGLAVDVDPSEGTLMEPFNPDWKTMDATWQRVLAIAKTHQLAEGACWPIEERDSPHLFPIEVPASPTPEMQQALKDAGVEGVWNLLKTTLPFLIR